MLMSEILKKVHHCIGHVMQGKFKLLVKYFRAESSVSYLLAWKADVNAIDSSGLSPLHLAVKAADELKSTRSVRHLLIKGADRGCVDL